MHTRKVVIVGAGRVGSHCALCLMFRHLVNQIVLIDVNREAAEAQRPRRVVHNPRRRLLRLRRCPLCHHDCRQEQEAWPDPSRDARRHDAGP